MGLCEWVSEWVGWSVLSAMRDWMLCQRDRTRERERVTVQEYIKYINTIENECLNELSERASNMSNGAWNWKRTTAKTKIDSNCMCVCVCVDKKTSSSRATTTSIVSNNNKVCMGTMKGGVTCIFEGGASSLICICVVWCYECIELNEANGECWRSTDRPSVRF